MLNKMKHYILSILSLCLLLVGCQQEELQESFGGKGYLSIEGLSVQAETPHLVTRATEVGVDALLNVDIYQVTDGVVATTPVVALQAGEDIRKVELTAGLYRLIAYNDAYEDYTTWTNEDKGEPIYYLEKDFTVSVGKVTYITEAAEMINFGVCLTTVAGEEWLDEMMFAATLVGGRTVTLSKNEKGYFPPINTLSAGASLLYSLKVKNKDGEEFDADGNPYYEEITGNKLTLANNQIKAGTLYEFVYELETKTLQLINETK